MDHIPFPTILLRRRVASLLSAACFSVAVLPAATWAQAPAAPKVRLSTSMGDIVLELYPDKAPKTVENFLRTCATNITTAPCFTESSATS
jgi:peptidyl-prolyl cis-trans isomerase A (cyclophilin A)